MGNVHLETTGHRSKPLSPATCPETQPDTSGYRTKWARASLLNPTGGQTLGLETAELRHRCRMECLCCSRGLGPALPPLPGFLATCPTELRNLKDRRRAFRTGKAPESERAPQSSARSPPARIPGPTGPHLAGTAAVLATPSPHAPCAAAPSHGPWSPVPAQGRGAHGAEAP